MKTRFNRTILVNHQWRHFHFIMGDYLKEYKVFSYEGKFQFWMVNCLNDAILDTWDE
ncbi:hypothetical protein D3C87_701200 [compost metagenome]